MITFLIGTLDSTAADSAVINVNGVGYEVLCSMRTLTQCSVGQQMKLLTHLHIREQEHTLFGFAEEGERAMFRQLIQISGVGPKVGLAILSALQPNQIIDAIITQSGKTLAQANGVGPKLGERIVRELKDKVGTLPTIATGGTVESMPTSSVAADVLSALTNMGFKETDVQQAVASASKELPDAPFDQLFKTSLQALR
ncbi:MAG: Holliday junction branch migration protein RuvA [Alphaproteobacteria bacterium]|nr:Holliday junction branch migration protein RuvA [Alphaproteobacteria bacterium]MDD9920523.1 Holliday junction branch migration protein RuvA [Alphaproteobacteria bacterium]